MLNMASRPQSLQDYLNDQWVSWMRTSGEGADRYVISNTTSAATCPRRWRKSPDLGDAVPLARLEAALAKVQKLEPAGVGARTVEECLLCR